MPMNNLRLGSAIAATIQSFKPDPGEEISVSDLEELWQAVSQDIIDEITNNADIVLQGGEIPIPGDGLTDSIPAPVTGQATNDAATISGQIQ